MARADGYYPSLSHDGQQIAFSSAQNLIGQNPDGNAEIFLWNPAAGVIAQITDSPRFYKITDPPRDYIRESEIGSIYPSISADGNRIAFLSDQNFVGENPDHFMEIFLLDRRSGLFSQMTRTRTRTKEAQNATAKVDAEQLGAVKISGNGRHAVFSSRADFTGQNPDGRAEIFLFEETPDTKWLQAIKEQELSTVTASKTYLEVAPAGSDTQIKLDDGAFLSDNNVIFNNVAPGSHTLTAEVPAGVKVFYAICTKATTCEGGFKEGIVGPGTVTTEPFTHVAGQNDKVTFVYSSPGMTYGSYP